MKKTLSTFYWIIHWILIIPLSFLSGYAVNLLVSVLCEKFLGESLSLTIFPLAEVFFFPFSMNFIFIWSANRLIPLVPKSKFKFLIALSMFLFVTQFIASLFVLPDDKLIQFVLPSSKSIMEIVIGVIGSVCGLMLAKRRIEK